MRYIKVDNQQAAKRLKELRAKLADEFLREIKL